MASPPQGDKNIEKLKVPPHSIEAEQSVLGSMLIDPESWDKVAELVTETDFYNRSHQIIFKAITRLLNISNPIDLITVSEELEKHDQLEVALANKSKTMSEISVNQADLSQQFDLKSAEHQNAIHELQTACAKLGSELEHCLGDQATIENVDRRYSDICTLLRTEQQKLVKSLEFVQQQSHTAVEAGERRCDSVAKDLTDRIDAMDAKFGEICRRSIDSAEAAMIEIARLKV